MVPIRYIIAQAVQGIASDAPDLFLCQPVPAFWAIKQQRFVSWFTLNVITVTSLVEDDDDVFFGEVGRKRRSEAVNRLAALTLTGPTRNAFTDYARTRSPCGWQEQAST